MSSRKNVVYNDDVVGAPRFEASENEKFDLGSLPEGAIGLTKKGTAAKKQAARKENKKETEKVAVFSERNLSWTEVGSLTKGYNIVNKEASEKWLTNPRVRLATPEEIKREYDL